ncbi:NADH-ubiquinone oxidoreductase chain 1 [Platanthera zijinensis]|uniref:NADH-ubiquinone oxidoreductase chain 1 n=1 Tax=Platanthera zijinensis TaxID=2320716 RepID=A0AAP0C0W4_9ASPA
MAFVQRRKGPDVVGSFGLLQPIADGLKLILKEPLSPSSANFSIFRMAPVAYLLRSRGFRKACSPIGSSPKGPFVSLL